MSDFISLQPRVPLDIIFLIIEASLPSLPIGACDYSTCANILLLNRTVYSTVIARIYHTVVIQTVAKLQGLSAILASSSHLNPVIYNLWINHEPNLPRHIKRYSITNDMLAIVKLTPNLRRLAIMTPLYYNNTHLDPIALANLVHFVVPSLWLTGSPDGGGVSIFSQFPKDLTALYIRGRVGSDEANRVVAHCPALRYVTVRVFASVVLSDLEKFARILVRELKDLLSLELMVDSGQYDALSSKLRGEGEDMVGSEAVNEKASVHVANDEENEMDLWMSESGSTRPTWAR